MTNDKILDCILSLEKIPKKRRYMTVDDHLDELERVPLDDRTLLMLKILENSSN